MSGSSNLLSLLAKGIRCLPREVGLGLIIGIDTTWVLIGDGGQMPNNRCSNCITYNHECTYVEAAKVRSLLYAKSMDNSIMTVNYQKRGPPKGYVEGLESRVVTMEKLLVKVRVSLISQYSPC